MKRIHLMTLLALTLTLIGATLTMAMQAGADKAAATALPRPKGPCDIYAAAGDPCTAAHSSTRALYASYNGPLYQVMRLSDGLKKDIGTVPASATDPGGYADAAAQDTFCANTYCFVTTLYDQSGKKNHLVQAPRGGFSGLGMGGFNNIPAADWAPITIMGHKAYGVFIAPGAGMRWNDAHGTAVDDQAEGQYWVINGHHYNSGCCYDYGNAETDSRDDGNGTMETTYFGTANVWYHGAPPGPWIMTDQENNLVGCVNADGSKNCPTLTNVNWRFVTAMADGEPHHWRSMGGDAQKGDLKVEFDGPRVNATYDPMRKQGGILLGNGGDNSNGSQGTFYEGAMTKAGTFPTQATNQLIHANIVAAKYDVARLTLAPAAAVATPTGIQTFSPQSSQDTTVTFNNTTGAPVTNLKLAIAAPLGWTAMASGPATIAGPVAPGASVSATFKVTSGSAAFNGDLVANATFTVKGKLQSEKAMEKVRNAPPVKINEFRISAGANQTDSFIELYNAGSSAADISGWTLTHHSAQLPIFSSVQVAAGTSVAPKGFYLIGLSNSGLSVPAKIGDSTIYVRSTAGMNAGGSITVGTGATAEVRKIASVGTAAGNPTTVWQPLPDGPVITMPAGSTNIPYTGQGGGRGAPEQPIFSVGQKVALGYGATYPTVSRSTEKYEVVTVTAVGKPGTQAWLTAPAKAGETNIKVSNLTNITAGDKIRLDIDSMGHGIEWVTVKSVGTASTRNAFNGALRPEDLGTGLELTAPLKFDHSSNIPFSARGTGITFKPATAFPHSSNEPVLALGEGIKLDQPLAKAHAINSVVSDAGVTMAGYQGPKPNQWFGGPVLANSGAMVLRNATGLVVDSLNYGGLVDAWAAEGYHTTGSPTAAACTVPAPTAGGRGGFPGQPAPASGPNRSSGRITDGLDTDSNCTDFATQAATSLAAPAAAGATNIKVANVAEFAAGQTIYIDSGANQQTAVIATVGTAGATAVGTAVAAGATTITVAGPAGFQPGQAIVIDSGANAENAVVVSATGGRGGFGGPGRGGQAPALTVTVSAPLKSAHAVGAQVAGTGITLTAPLSTAHESGAQVAGGIPTPGAPNQYVRSAGRR